MVGRCRAGVAVVAGRWEGVLAGTAAAASSTSRLSALVRVRTRSYGAMAPSVMLSSGLTARADPSSACAAPIRPPRRRYSKVST